MGRVDRGGISDGVLIAPRGLTNYNKATNDAIIARALLGDVQRIRFPAGDYPISATTGTILNMASNHGLEIFGDGAEKTNFILADNLTLSGNLFVIYMTGLNQKVHDLSIYNGAGMTAGVSDVSFTGVQASGGYYPIISRVNVVGVYGNTTAGGTGIGLYQPRNAVENVATLGTTITAGTRTVTPSSMDGIYPGQRVGVGLSDSTNIEGADEQVIVASTTATTFTAPFVHNHLSSEIIGIPSRGNQYALVEDCVVRDSYAATAFGSSGAQNSVFKRCKARNIGSVPQQHGWYVQGNVELDECYGEGIFGYTYHGHMQAPNLDASGFRMRNCTSVNPRFAHGIIDSVGASDGTNYDVPSGKDLNRYASVTGCTFRSSRGALTSSGFNVSIPTILSNNLFEDATASSGTGAAWLALQAGADGSILQSNHFNGMTAPGYVGVYISGITKYSAIGNTFKDASTEGSFAIYAASSQGTMLGNTVDFAYGTGLQVGSNTILSGNDVTVTNGACLDFGSSTGWTSYGNRLSSSTAFVVSQGGITGKFRFNEVAGSYRYDNVGTVVLEGNSGTFTQSGYAALALTGKEGQLLQGVQSSGTGPAAGYGVILASGLMQRAATNSTQLVGIAVGDGNSSGYIVYVAHEQGKTIQIYMDGAGAGTWTIGNIAVPSTTTAGRFKDNGTTVPTYPASYLRFLDSGSGTGLATAVICKMG